MSAVRHWKTSELNQLRLVAETEDKQRTAYELTLARAVRWLIEHQTLPVGMPALFHGQHLVLRALLSLTPPAPPAQPEVDG